MNLESVRNELQAALDQQLTDQKKALDNNRRLEDEQITYANEARGTLYSGMPTWQRANTAANYATKLNDLNASYAKNKVKVWDTFQSAIDQINAYNEAAAELGGAGYTPQIPAYSPQPADTPVILNGQVYYYRNGKLVKG